MQGAQPGEIEHASIVAPRTSVSNASSIPEDIRAGATRSGGRCSDHASRTHRTRRTRRRRLGLQLRGHRDRPRPLPAPAAVRAALPRRSPARRVLRRAAQGRLEVDRGGRDRPRRRQVRAALHRHGRGDAGRPVLPRPAGPGRLHRRPRRRRAARAAGPGTGAGHGRGAGRDRGRGGGRGDLRAGARLHPGRGGRRLLGRVQRPDPDGRPAPRPELHGVGVHGARAAAARALAGAGGARAGPGRAARPRLVRGGRHRLRRLGVHRLRLRRLELPAAPLPGLLGGPVLAARPGVRDVLRGPGARGVRLRAALAGGCPAGGRGGADLAGPRARREPYGVGSGVSAGSPPATAAASPVPSGSLRTSGAAAPRSG